jgi:hypothetical protein
MRFRPVPRARRLGLAFALGLLAAGRAGLPSAHAQVAISPAPAAVGEEESLEVETAPPRPRLSLAVGMGATRDATGFPDGARLVPAFLAEGGFGDGFLGLDFGAFSSSAFGRYTGPDQFPIDRLALDAFEVLRPAGLYRREDQRYRMRVLHTGAVELGVGLERDGTTTASGTRFVIHTGARIEFPLARRGQPSELRLRLAVRRAFGLYTPIVAAGPPGSTVNIAVGDSIEGFAALAVVF